MIDLPRPVLFVVAAGLLGVLLFAAPPLLGPIYDEYFDSYWGYSQGKTALDRSLNSCAHDELLFVLYFDQHGSEGAKFDFKTRQLSGGYVNPAISWSWLGRTISPNGDISFSEGPLFTDAQIGTIKALLAGLPAPKDAGWANAADYRDQIHLAFYQGDQLHVYHYSKGEAHDQLEELCRLLGIPDKVP